MQGPNKPARSTHGVVKWKTTSKLGRQMVSWNATVLTALQSFLFCSPSLFEECVAQGHELENRFDLRMVAKCRTTHIGWSGLAPRGPEQNSKDPLANVEELFHPWEGLGGDPTLVLCDSVVGLQL